MPSESQDALGQNLGWLKGRTRSKRGVLHRVTLNRVTLLGQFLFQGNKKAPSMAVIVTRKVTTPWSHLDHLEHEQLVILFNACSFLVS